MSSDRVVRARSALASAWLALCEAHDQTPFEVEGTVATFTRRAEPLGNQCHVHDPSIDVTRLIEALGRTGSRYVIEIDGDLGDAIADAVRAGLTRRTTLPFMVLDARNATSTVVPDALTIRRAEPADHEVFRRVSGAGFGAPREVADLFGASRLLDRPEGNAFLGFIGTEPVATSYRWTHDGTTAVFNVATLHDHRGKGIGRAMTDAAMRADPDADLTCLQASDMGRPVYEAMGFWTVATSVIFEGPAPLR